MSIFSSIESLSRVQLFVTPWIAACQASLSITNSRSLLKLRCPLHQWCHPTTVVPFSSCLQSFPGSGSFLVSQLFESGSQRIGVSALASVFPMNIQDWFHLGWTGWISLQSKGLSRVFSNTTVQKHQFFGVQLSSQSNSHIHTWPLTGKTIALTRRTFVGRVMSLLLNMLYSLVIAFLPRSRCLLISWLQSPSAVILEPPRIKVCHCSTVAHLFAMKWWDQMPWS